MSEAGGSESDVHIALILAFFGAIINQQQVKVCLTIGKGE
jgi:hypothetical protein